MPFDGVLYPSLNNYPAASIALFERATAKVSVIEDIDLVDHADWPRFPARWNLMTMGLEAGGQQVEATRRTYWSKLKYEFLM